MIKGLLWNIIYNAQGMLTWNSLLHIDPCTLLVTFGMSNLRGKVDDALCFYYQSVLNNSTKFSREALTEDATGTDSTIFVHTGLQYKTMAPAIPELAYNKPL